uniref:Uncharacterized protein n=1 Tax=Parascaris equorum TaxID=6256 RepID=A0A914S2J0_PAREQ
MEILCDDGAQNPRTSRRRAGKKPIDLSDLNQRFACYFAIAERIVATGNAYIAQAYD